MEETSLSKKLAVYLLENFDVSISRRGKVKIKDFTLAGNGVATRFYNTVVEQNKVMFKDIKEDWLYLPMDEAKAQITNILPSVIEHIEEHFEATERNKELEEIKIAPHLQMYYDCFPVVDIENLRGSAKIVYKGDLRVTEIQEKAWERIVTPKHAKAQLELGYSGYFKYDPYSVEAYKEIEERGSIVPVYNTFKPPMHLVERDKDAKLDDRFIEFLETFFESTCKDYAYNWIYHSTFKKMETYLVLVGAGGTGKNLLAEAIKQLHGVGNFTKAPPSALDSKFNGHLKDCTMVYYDECKFSSDRNGTVKKNRLKEWSNGYVPIEIKGVDAVNEDIYCSAIIATNNDSDVHMEQLDRKFSVMEITDERLENRLGVETTQFLWRYILEDNFADAWLNWLESKIDSDFNIYKEYKGPKFNNLVISSLSTWQQSLIFDYVLSGLKERYSFSEIKDDVITFPSQAAKVEDFLLNFLWEGERLGKVVRDSGKIYVEVAKKFAPDTDKEDQLD